MSLLDDILRIEESAKGECASASDAAGLDALRNKYLGRKGELAEAMGRLKGVDPAEKPRTGQEANRVKNELERLFQEKQAGLGKGASAGRSSQDLTLPGTAPLQGGLHPLTQVTDEICDIFSRLGFSVATGPEAETEHYNF